MTNSIISLCQFVASSNKINFQWIIFYFRKASDNSEFRHIHIPSIHRYNILILFNLYLSPPLTNTNISSPPLWMYLRMCVCMSFFIYSIPCFDFTFIRAFYWIDYVLGLSYFSHVCMCLCFWQCVMVQARRKLPCETHKLIFFSPPPFFSGGIKRTVQMWLNFQLNDFENSSSSNFTETIYTLHI